MTESHSVYAPISGTQVWRARNCLPVLHSISDPLDRRFDFSASLLRGILIKSSVLLPGIVGVVVVGGNGSLISICSPMGPYLYYVTQILGKNDPYPPPVTPP